MQLNTNERAAGYGYTADEEWLVMVEELAGQLAVLRQRLTAAEQALGLPLPPGRPAPASVPDLGRRLAALERRAGVIPGLAPLPGFSAPRTPTGSLAVVALPPDQRRTDWATWGGALLVVALVVLLVVWPVRVPTPPVVATPLPTPHGIAVPARPIVPLSVPGTPTDLVDWEQEDRTHVAPSQPGPLLDWEQADRLQVAPPQLVPLLDWEQAERTQVAP